MAHPSSAPGGHTEQQAPLRVLVVEDNLLIAETIGDVLKACGCAVIGPASNIKRGLLLLDTERPDGAMLDVNLSGKFCFPLAAVLKERGIPFVFMTGYDEGTIFPPEFRDIRRLSKPFDHTDIAEVIEIWERIGRV